MQKSKGKGGPDPIDVHVGSRLRARRILLGLSQEKLAEGLGITFQQVQKYERGSNRISASRLYNTAKLLAVPVAYFFEGAETDDSVRPLEAAGGAAGELPEDLMNRKETLSLLRHYYAINDQNLRQRFTDLLKGVSRSDSRG